ncbi:hypothetical protein GA830_17230 [Mesorhizobium sp. NBSH29]|nr:hypothetical protein GA830_17230 [Mesorhizobium sp. NBSH29]
MPKCTVVTPNLPELTLLAEAIVGAAAAGQEPPLRHRFAVPPLPHCVGARHNGEVGAMSFLSPVDLGRGGARRLTEWGTIDAPATSEHLPDVPALVQHQAAILLAAAPAVLVKGGHAIGTRAIDILFRSGQSPLPFTAARHDKTMRGTGCMLASAIAANLAGGRDLTDAIASAKAHVAGRFA